MKGKETDKRKNKPKLLRPCYSNKTGRGCGEMFMRTNKESLCQKCSMKEFRKRDMEKQRKYYDKQQGEKNKNAVCR